MNKIKEWWLGLAKDTKFSIVLLVVVIAMVIWLCGIKGNNQDNFYYKKDVAVAMADTTKKVPTIMIRFPGRPNVPIRGINIVRG